MRKDKRSPLKASPLRLPGQSLHKYREDQIYDYVLTPFFLALFGLVLAGLEWFRWYTGMPPEPKLYTVCAVLLVTYAVIAIRRTWPRLRALKQARDGERAVGQQLEELRKQGFQVLHDIVGDEFNIDHVLIGPAGVFTIETKTISKPVRGDPKISFDGQSISIAGAQLTRNPVIQAKAQARWLKDLIAQSTGRTVEVWPVVVFPGWYVEHAAGAHKEIWVLNPKGLPSFLAQEPVRLTPEDVQLVTYHLSQYVRQSANKK